MPWNFAAKNSMAWKLFLENFHTMEILRTAFLAPGCRGSGSGGEKGARVRGESALVLEAQPPGLKLIQEKKEKYQRPNEGKKLEILFQGTLPAREIEPKPPIIDDRWGRPAALYFHRWEIYQLRASF